MSLCTEACSLKQHLCRCYCRTEGAGNGYQALQKYAGCTAHRLDVKKAAILESWGRLSKQVERCIAENYVDAYCNVQVTI